MGITAFKERGYRCGWKRSDKAHFYRFTEPRKGYPVQIGCFQESQIIILRLNLGLFLFILMMMYQAFQQSC